MGLLVKVSLVSSLSLTREVGLAAVSFMRFCGTAPAEIGVLVHCTLLKAVWSLSPALLRR